jgi:hypothetical protein
MKINFITVSLLGLVSLNGLALGKVSEGKLKNNVTPFLSFTQEGSKMQNDDYKKFRDEQQKKIEDNKKMIADLRSKKDKVKEENKAAYDYKIDAMEKKNDEMRKKIVENYKDEGKEKWESFKKEFNHDMDELGGSIQDLFKNNAD